MAQVNFATSRVKTIGGIEVDAFLREQHSRSTQVSDIQVEDGSNISDNAVLDPIPLSIEGIIGPGAASTGSGAPTNRVLEAFNKLDNLWQTAAVISVRTGLKIYDNMMITSFDVDRDASNGQSLPFTMTLKQTRIIKSQTVTIPKAKLGGDDGTQKQAQSVADTGRSKAAESQAEWLNGIRKNVRNILGGTAQ